ncbi:MAG: PKD domain-containing protein [Pontiellaceae bacterium]|nr:PKD domain-containing protein [Pontiellaceae bacterium]
MKKGLVFLFAAMAGTNLMAATLHVDLNSTNPTAPYASRETAAKNIQTAVNAAAAGDTVQVWDGHYLLASQISVSKAITIQSVNGPDTTIVDGQRTVRCFNLSNSACVIEGLSMKNGYSSGDGGGIYCSGTIPVVSNCIITGNSANSGGGMYGGTAINCTISRNSAGGGGGMFDGTANNCTITGNSANSGGGMFGGSANNCIVWYNTAPSGTDLDFTTASYSCSPDVMHGLDGNITNAPMLVSSSHIAADSLCRGAGSINFVSGTDIDGEAWANPPSMGCDEPADLPGGPIEVDFIANESMVVSGYPVQFQEQIHGALSQHVWDFGDGTQITNSLFVEHAWAALGTYDVVLTAYNADWPGGVSATQEVSVISFEETAIHVSPNGNDANDGTSWASAKATIQAGVDAQDLLGGGVLVGSGTYSLSAEITVSKPVRIVSVEGPGTTIVDGLSSVRCFNLGNSACVVEGLTITNGFSTGYGGGIYCSGTTPVVTHCIMSGNTAGIYGGGIYYGTANNCTISFNSAGYNGGGMYRGMANNCTISGNSATQYGGGIYDGTANNCTISGNSASIEGGGMDGGMANNSIIWYNTAFSGKDLWDTIASYSCSPGVTHGVDGNITNAPGLVSSLHIAADSPCRGAGSVEYAGWTDIDGEAWANPPSMGCDEPSDDLPRGPIAVDVLANESMVAFGYPIRFWEQIHGSLSAHVWDFGDGTRVTNSPSVEHVWATAGTFDVVLTAYNADWPGGVSATQEVSIVSLQESAIYVSTDGDDANDGTSWASAKATIQAGVDAQGLPGGRVLVGSGSYSLSATIRVNMPIRIVGVDGPGSSIVDGNGKVCCFSLRNTPCVIDGLTITNGNGGYSSGGGISCLDTTPVVTNCIISGNSASYGGGMYSGTANNCILSGNSAFEHGGGMLEGTANNCILSGNSAGVSGGGMDFGTANNCILSENTAKWQGGGMDWCTANNCTLIGNSAFERGGGMCFGTANNCTLIGNSAKDGGGMLGVTANNCTLSGNSASRYGGGMENGTANNCIVWYNTASSGKDLYDTTASYSCSPDVTHGVDGNITNAPMLVSSSHIAADSPCGGAGSPDYASGKDIDGESWANPPSMGCDEPADVPGGPVAVDFEANESIAVSGYPIRFWEQIHGLLSAHVWDFGDGTRVTNSPSVEHIWATAGTFDVVLTAYNADWPGGVSVTQAVVILDGATTAIHVSPDGNDANDGSSWASAKGTIQAGIDAQGLRGGWILLGSGTYSLSATITVNKPIRIVGVDGPGATIVDGQKKGRCFNLGNIACVIQGLTITNGYFNGDGGGIYCSGMVPVVTNCTISGNSAGGSGGGMYGGTANNCIIIRNTASSGGGMVRATANHCTISGNAASGSGGGIYDGTANHCTISGNSAGGSGGGMYGGTANNCILSGNSAEYGGGMDGGTANNCTISGNSAKYGGGIDGGTANNCIFSGNSASSYGGGMSRGTANNCTISGNTAYYGGGMYEGTANNSIIYCNNADDGNDLWNTAASYSCSPDAMHGVNGNITNAPMMVSSSHIAVDSPCRGAGSTNFVSGTDIDAEAWANPPSMGCDEPSGNLPGGNLSVAILNSGSRAPSGYVLEFIGVVVGNASIYVWDFGDGTRITNSPSVEHVWAAAGTFDVVLTAYNTDWPEGVAATQNVNIVSHEDFVFYVSPDGDDANDGTSWASAKETIEAGVDAQYLVDGWVMVGAGTYPLSSSIFVSKPVRIVGAEGPDATIVDGQGSVRCFNLGNSACVLEGMTITNGYRSGDGGGIYCSGTTPVVTNCIISGNSTTRYGGGIYKGTANNCTISNNKATMYGGGMYQGTGNNCTISGNSATEGGGMYNGTANNCTISGNSASSSGGGMRSGTANNCIVWYNTAPSWNDLYGITARYSCSPDVTDGSNGNMTNAPVFVDAANGDYRLAAGSRCIDAGSNRYVVGSLDLDSMPRILGGVVDMGAYEYYNEDEDDDGLPDDWERVHFGGSAGQGAEDDFDNDGIDNGSEWIAGTNPSDPNSVFTASVSSNPVSADGFVVEWLSVEDRTYSVLWRGSLTNTNDVLQDGIEYPQNSYTDTVHVVESAGFYQIGVRLK